MRAVRLIVVMILALVVTGCVYLRLLALRDQLREFDTYFSVELPDATHQRMALIAKEPVLEVADVTWLLGGGPTTHVDGPPAQQCWRFVKIVTPGDPAALPGRVLELETTAEHGLVARVVLPTAVTNAIAPELILRVLRALGLASIDRTKRMANATVPALSQPALVPTRAELIGLFGIPNRPVTVKSKDIEVMSYGYQLELPPAAAGEPPRQTVEAVVLFGFKPGAERPYLFLFSSAGNWVSIDLRTDPTKP